MDILNLLRKQHTLGGEQEQMERISGGPVQYKPRTLRETIDDQISHHKSKITDLEEAKKSLTPDVERALNALAKI